MIVLILWVVGTLPSRYAVHAANCETPSLPHGLIDGAGDPSSWTGTFSCLPGYTLVGNIALKCRGGQWSGDIPVCAILDGCVPGDLPEVEHGRKYSYRSKRYRGGVYKYSCYKGYQKIGASLVWCEGGRWSGSGHATVCAKPGCEEDMVNFIHNGKVAKEVDGVAFTFSCMEGGVLDGPVMVHCDGSMWSSAPPQCLSPTAPPSLSIEVGGNISPSIAAGDLVTVVCHAKGGNPQPILSLYMNKTPIGDPREAQNLHTFQTKPEQNSASITCSAINSLMTTPLSSEVVLNILFGPSSVHISPPPSPLLSGQPSTLSCSSSSSNPPAVLHWSVLDGKGREVDTPALLPDTSTTWAGHGWITSSTIQLNYIANLRFVCVQCTATNTALQHKVMDKVVVTKNSPPTTVTISSQPHQAVPGEVVEVRCVSSPSVPPAHLHWVVMQDTQKMEFTPEQEEEIEEDGSWRTTSTLEFVAGDGDEVVVECIARHNGLEDDTVAHVHVIRIGQPEKKITNKAQTINEKMSELSLKEDEVVDSAKQEDNSITIVSNNSDASVQNVFDVGEDTANENPENLTNLTDTNDAEENVGNTVIKEYDNMNEEASAIKDSKSFNNSRENIYSAFCMSICYLLLTYYN